MKILIAPDSFKESLSALEVARNIEKGIKTVIPETDCILLPMADGGEGTVQSMVDATGGQIINTVVHDPLMREINGFFGILGNGRTAVIEMAAASGIELLQETEKDPYHTTTFGTGELLRSAIEKGCSEIIIGIGGSATNDGGMGMASALGVRFHDKYGKEIPQGGKYLGEIEEIDASEIISEAKTIHFTIASDVSNPLCGPEGASYVFGPQKGATPGQVSILDAGLNHFGDLIEKMSGKTIKNVPGAGAAGGLGAGLMAFLNADMKPGFEVVKEITHLEDHIKNVDIVITGEGKIDSQTQYGKTPFGVAQTAKKQGKKVIAFAGTVGDDIDILYENCFDHILPISEKPVPLKYSLENAPDLLQNAAQRMMRLLNIGM
ncbi:glycerate kinase [Bacteroidota bacterium]